MNGLGLVEQVSTLARVQGRIGVAKEFVAEVDAALGVVEGAISRVSRKRVGVQIHQVGSGARQARAAVDAVDEAVKLLGQDVAALGFEGNANRIVDDAYDGVTHLTWSVSSGIHSIDRGYSRLFNTHDGSGRIEYERSILLAGGDDVRRLIEGHTYPTGFGGFKRRSTSEFRTTAHALRDALDRLNSAISEASQTSQAVSSVTTRVQERLATRLQAVDEITGGPAVQALMGESLRVRAELGSIERDIAYAIASDIARVTTDDVSRAALASAVAHAEVDELAARYVTA